MITWARGCALTAATAIAVGGGWAAPLTAHADVTSVSYVTGLSDEGDYGGQGAPFELWTPGGGTINVSGDATKVVLSTTGAGPYRFLTFAAPDGQSLTAGAYAGATAMSSRVAGRPGIDVSSATSACNDHTGRFDISDLHVADSGVVDRLRLHYEQRCTGDTVTGELVGDVAINEAPVDPSVILVPETVTFPATYSGTTSATAEVRLVNEQAAPLTVSAVTIGGADAAKFQLVSTSCTAAPLSPGSDCAASITFAPGADHSTAAASLTFSDDSAAGSHSVPLSASVQPGYTSWSMVGDRDDTLLGPTMIDHTPPTAPIVATGNASSITASVIPNGRPYRLTLAAPDGQSLAAGDYPNATSSSTSGPRMTVWFGGTCSTPQAGSFHIGEIAFDPDTGDLTTLSATFEDHCGGSSAAVYGSIAWHATNPAAERAGPGSSSDVTGPAAPGIMARYGGLHQVLLSWFNPQDADWDHTVVREAAGTTPPASPTSGIGVYSGRGQTVTITRLPSGVTYSYSLWSVDTRGNWSVAARTFVRGTVTILALPRPAPYGVGFTAAAETIDLVSGQPLRGYIVNFQVRYPGSTRWYSAGGAYTDARGVATTSLLFTRPEYVRVLFTGQPGLIGSGTSAVYVPLSPGIVGTYLGSLKPGGTEKISGTILPNLAGQRVYLQRHWAGKWNAFKSMLLTSRSSFSFAFSLPAGSYTYRLYMPAVRGFQPLYSQSMIVTVR